MSLSYIWSFDIVELQFHIIKENKHLEHQIYVL